MNAQASTARAEPIKPVHVGDHCANGGSGGISASSISRAKRRYRRVT